MRIMFIHGKTAGSTLLDLLSRANLNWTNVHDLSFTEDKIDALVEPHDLYIISTRDPVSRILSAFNWMHYDGGGAWGLGSDDLSSLMLRSMLRSRLDDLSAGGSILQPLSACFDALPGGANAFAESLGGEGNCSNIARRSLTEPSAGSGACTTERAWPVPKGPPSRARVDDVAGHLAKGVAWYLSRTHGPSANETVIDQMRKPGAHIFHVSQENFNDDVNALWKWLCVEPSSAVDES